MTRAATLIVPVGCLFIALACDDGAVPTDAAHPDGGGDPDSSVADSSVADGRVLDSHVRDSGVADSNRPDSGVLDSFIADGGPSDTGTSDARPDATVGSGLCWSEQGTPAYLPYPANRNGFSCTEVSPGIGYGRVWGGYSQWPAGDPAILHVTNLNDSGPGSLRAAMTASGCRVVVFDVSGEIQLSSQITAHDGCLTVNGHTAPGPVWVTLDTADISVGIVNIRGNNVILEGLALAATPPITCGNVRALSTGATASDLLFLNLALLGGTDQNNDQGRGDNWQYIDTLFASPQGNTTCSHAFNFLAENADTHGLLLGMVFANSRNRNPRALVEQMTWFNTYVYNVSKARVADIQVDLGDGSSPDFTLNISDFWYESGPDASTTPSAIRLGPGASDMGAGSEIYIDRIRVDTGFCSDPWDMACVNNQTTSEAVLRHDATDNFPRGASPTSTAGMSEAEHRTLMLQNNGPWPNRRTPDLQALYDGIVAGTLRIEDAYMYAVAPEMRATYDEGVSPHSDADANGYPDLMDQFESDRRATYGN